MGGSDALFEESKTSGDAIDMVERTVNMFNTHPVYSCAALGTFFFAMFVYAFLQR